MYEAKIYEADPETGKIITSHHHIFLMVSITSKDNSFHTFRGIISEEYPELSSPSKQFVLKTEKGTFDNFRVNSYIPQKECIPNSNPIFFINFDGSGVLRDKK